MSLTAAVRRETVYLSAILRTLWMLRKVKPDSRRTIVDIVEAHARRTPNAPAVYCQDEVITYAAITEVYETEVYVDRNDITGAVNVLPLSRKYRDELARRGASRSGGG